MLADTMLSFLQDCTPEEQFGFRVATQCAQVLKNVKLANLITLGTGSWHQIRSCLKMSRVICIMLYADGHHEVLYLYRYEQLENHLKRADVREFLSSCGYEIFEIAAVMRRLRLRYQRYAGAGAEFPHELGVLLEYPVADVKSFIDNRGENSLKARYWKVYHNLPEAERIFRIYDEARRQAFMEITGGCSLAHVAVS